MTGIAKRSLFLGLVLAAACSQKPAQNYRNCLKLRVDMTREQVLQVMGAPDETFPYVEGKSLPHLKGRTAYEWATPASMPAPNRVSIDDASGRAESIRCGDSTVNTSVFVEPAAPRSDPREHAASAQSSGRPLTD